MGRHKTISDDDVLAAARRVFREQGHAASTRDIARFAGVSQAVLYQRFGNKDELFFTAMAPSAPDLEHIFGPSAPGQDAHAYLLGVVERMAGYFSEVLPVAIQVMMHPSFDMKNFTKFQHMNAAAQLGGSLARRLQAFERQGQISPGTADAAAGLLTTLAHDWGLRSAMSRADPVTGRRELTRMIEVVWHGLAPSGGAARARSKPTRRRGASSG